MQPTTSPNLSLRTLQRISPALSRVAASYDTAASIERRHGNHGTAGMAAGQASAVRALEQSLRLGGSPGDLAPRDPITGDLLGYIQPHALPDHEQLWAGVSAVASHTTSLWVADPCALKHGRGDGALLASFLRRVRIGGRVPASAIGPWGRI